MKKVSDEIKALRRDNKVMAGLLESKSGEGGELKKDLRAVDQKTEEAKAIREILLAAIHEKKEEKKKQQASYAKVLEVAEKQTAQIKALGLDKAETYEQYSKLKEEREALQAKAGHMHAGRNRKRRMKLQMVEGYRRINDDMIGQIQRQRQLLEEQKAAVESLADREAEYQRKRELQKRQYQAQLDQLRDHYTMTTTLAELELMALRSREPAKSETFLNRSTRAMETEDFPDESPDKGTRLLPDPSDREEHPGRKLDTIYYDPNLRGQQEPSEDLEESAHLKVASSQQALWGQEGRDRDDAEDKGIGVQDWD